MPPIKESNILPADFDGVFRFTNPTDRDITCKWNNVAYTYPAMTTSPMVISGESPEAVQHIRRKFAMELATREFYRSGRYNELNNQALPQSGNIAAIYTDEDLAGWIQACLDPLTPARASAVALPRDSTDKYHTNVTKVLDKDAMENKTPLAAGSEQIVG